jgi:hypothetical protein
MSSMSSHDTGVPVEEQHPYSGSRRADVDDQSKDDQANAVDEDVVVIETRDAVDDRDPDAFDHREASPGTIWSAADSGPAEAMAEEPSAGDPAASGALAAESLAEEPESATGRPAADAVQWSEIKAMFVDDPGDSVKRASGLVERAMEDLMSSLRERQESLGSWQANDASGTEELRNALRGYQSLFDEIDGMSSRFRPGPERLGSA